MSARPAEMIKSGQHKHHASVWGHIPSLLRWSIVIRTDSTISIMVTAVLRRHHCLLGWVSFLRGRRHLGISACFIAEGIPWPLGPMAGPHGRGPHGPGQLRPNFRCLFIRKERCGWHMPSFIPTRRLLYVSRINYKSHIPVWTSRQDIILFFILTLRALYVTPLPLDRYSIFQFCLVA